MNDEWMNATLGACCDFVNQKADPKTLHADTIYIGLEHITPEVGRVYQCGITADVSSMVILFQQDDVLFGRLRPYLKKVVYAHSSGVCSPEVLVLRARTDVISPGFLYLVASRDAAIDHAVALSAGSRMPRTAPSDLASLPILLPPLPIQRRIVDLMAHLDNHLANLRAERTAAKQLLVALRDDLLASTLDWTESTLGDLTKKIGSGATPRGGESAYVQAGISLIRSQNVYDFRFQWEGLARITDSQARLLDGVTVECGDVLINITGASVNRVCCVPDSVLPARVNQHVAILRPDINVLDSSFLAHLLRRSDLKVSLDILSGSGTTRQAITKLQLESFVVTLPNIAEQRKRASLLDDQVRVIDCFSKEVEAFVVFRARVLNALLDGVVSLAADYDIFLPEVA
ncbi:MAG: restriction endonuclease subunit S [Candidatus Planktophila sp.]|nr:restriction endonuclease subunit S [Candidatus Planktophila sp.]